MSACNILISSAGRRVALLNLWKAALRELNLDGWVGAIDVTPLAAAWQAADRRWLLPRCDAPEYIPSLVNLCAREGIRVIVPTIDTELPVLAAHRASFADIGVTVLVSAPETVQIASDKRATNAWLVTSEFPTVRQTTIAGALDRPSEWPLPLIAKPRAGSASVGLVRADTLAALQTLAPDDRYVVETVAPGHEHTVDVLIDRQGQPRCAVPRKRLEVRAGEISKGVTVRNSAIQSLAMSVGQALPGAFGALNIQLFATDSFDLSIIEINARFGGGFPLAARAGANFPKWILEEILGRPSSASADEWVDGLTMLRYDAEIFVPASAGVRA